MQFALNEKRERVRPSPKARAICPACDSKVRARCGNVNIHHWSHESNEDCLGGKEETAWHREMKARYPEHCQEVVVKNDLGIVIADVLEPNSNTALEFDFKSQLGTKDILRKNAIFAASGIKVYWYFRVERDVEDAVESSKNGTSYWFKHGLRRLLGFNQHFCLWFNNDRIFFVKEYWYFEKARRIYFKV